MATIAPPGTPPGELWEHACWSQALKRLSTRSYACVFRRSREWLLRTFRPEGLERLDAVLGAGEAAIVLGTHAGCLGWIEPVLRQLGYRVHPPPRRIIGAEALLLLRREGLAERIVVRPELPEQGLYLKRLLDCLRSGESVQIVGDSPDPETGLDGECLGARVRCRSAPWVLARLSGAPVLPILILMDRSFAFKLHVGPPLRVDGPAAMAPAFQQYLAFLTDRLADQWWNVQLTQWEAMTSRP
jgi:lauroyl/myristoyl acyltransferase